MNVLRLEDHSHIVTGDKSFDYNVFQQIANSRIQKSSQSVVLSVYQNSDIIINNAVDYSALTVMADAEHNRKSSFF